MTTKGDGKERTVKVAKLTEFTIDYIQPLVNSEYCTLTLKETDSRRLYYKNVVFSNLEDLPVTADAKKEDLFGYIFAMGEGKLRETTAAARAAIRAGRVILGMTADEVDMAMGQADTVTDTDGLEKWIYKRSKGKSLVVQFGREGKVINVHTIGGNTSSSSSSSTSRTSPTQPAKTQKAARRQNESPVNRP